MGLHVAFGGLMLGAVASASGCSEPEPPRLVAMPGCGIEDGLIDNLLVKARGDFPEGSGTELRLSGGEQSLAWGDRAVVGITVEGLFGQAVEAVGRTSRLHEEGELPVYFARVDGLCQVADDAAPRQEVAAAVGSMGDVVIGGGRGVQGALRDEVLYLHDDDGVLTELPGRLPVAITGQSIHWLDERRFLMFGGASADAVVRDEVVRIDLDDEFEPIGAVLPVPLVPVLGPARAYHAAAVDSQGRILVTGGCRRVTEELECTVDDDDPHEGPSVLHTSLWIEPNGSELDFYEGPALAQPRFGAALVFARDGVAYVAGGWDELGFPVHTVERLRPGSTQFEPYGGGFGDALGNSPVVGTTVLDGGIVLLALDNGQIHWITEQDRDDYRPWGGWCEEGGECFPNNASSSTRGILALPGERVIMDGMVLPALGIGQTGVDARDPFAVGPRSPSPPPRRTGTRPVLLADGSVLLLGGRHSDSGSLATPVALRMRPALDGPDEGIPDFDRTLVGNLIVHDAERVVLEGETIRMLAAGDIGASFPIARAHARGFRSASFRFEVTMQVVSGDAVPHLVLEHGGVEAVSVSLEPDRVQAHIRDPQGVQVDISCASRGLEFSLAPQVLRFEVTPGFIQLSRASEVVAQCPGLNDRPWSVGIGAAGGGELLVSGLRLTRQ